MSGIGDNTGGDLYLPLTPDEILARLLTVQLPDQSAHRVAAHALAINAHPDRPNQLQAVLLSQVFG